MTETLTAVEMEKAAANSMFTSDQKAKLVIRTEVLKEAIRKVSGTIKPHNTIPALAGIYMHANNDRIVFRASNSNYSTEYIVDDLESFMVDGNEAAIVFPGKKFADIINKMTGKNITIEFDGLWTKIKSGGAKPSLAGMHHEEFPRFPEVNPQTSFSMSAASLLKMYHKTMYAASTSETRPVLTGINHEIIDKEFRCIVTDSHRLSRQYHNLPVEVENMNKTVPADTIKEVIKHLAQSEIVELAFDESNVIYKMDSATIYSRVLEGNYPATDRLIPPKVQTTARFIVGNLISLLERVNLFKDDTQQNAVANMIIHADDGQMRVLSNNTSMGQAQEDIVISKGTGNNLVLCASVKFLLDALKTYDVNEEIEFGFVSATTPFTIRALSEDERNIDLVLPIRPTKEIEDEIKDFNPGEGEDDPLLKRNETEKMEVA